MEEQEDLVDFGPLPPHINALLQQGVACHRSDPARARALFGSAIQLAPDALPAYRALFKHLNRLREFDAALEVAATGLLEATRQAGVSPDWRLWRRAELGDLQEAPQRFLLQFLKAIAFIQLRRGQPAITREALAQLQALDPEDGCGASVLAALLDEMEDA
ncbi:MAG: hypothetical protein RBS40_10635 [Rhodocyclaceae bacterium]|jgi:hypothetical protein|nr:hypothetical protein [Rhodocyclaceae bacterium]